jgi:hypothetical protein
MMKTISIIVTVGVLVYYFVTGVYDPFSLTTTSDIKSNYTQYIGKTIKLQKVSILNAEVIEEKNKQSLIRLTLYNLKSLFGSLDSTDYFKHKDNAIDVYAWIPDTSGLWGYVNKGWYNAAFFRLQVEKDFIAIIEYAEGGSYAEGADSWFIAPYLISLFVLNSFLPLAVSAISSTIIQLLVIFIIARLVIEGIIYVLPGG